MKVLTVGHLRRLLGDLDQSLPVFTAVDIGSVVCKFVELDPEHVRESVISTGQDNQVRCLTIWPDNMLSEPIDRTSKMLAMLTQMDDGDLSNLVDLLIQIRDASGDPEKLPKQPVYESAQALSE